MTVVAQTLIEPILLTTADVTLYTAPANTRVIIDKFTAANTTAGAITITVNLVASGGAASATNTLISARSVSAGATDLCPEIVGHILNPGDFISAKASANTSIGLRASGRAVS